MQFVVAKDVDVVILTKSCALFRPRIGGAGEYNKWGHTIIECRDKAGIMFSFLPVVGHWQFATVVQVGQQTALNDFLLVSVPS